MGDCHRCQRLAYLKLLAGVYRLSFALLYPNRTRIYFNIVTIVVATSIDSEDGRDPSDVVGNDSGIVEWMKTKEAIFQTMRA